MRGNIVGGIKRCRRCRNIPADGRLSTGAGLCRICETQQEQANSRRARETIGRLDRRLSAVGSERLATALGIRPVMACGDDSTVTAGANGGVSAAERFRTGRMDVCAAMQVKYGLNDRPSTALAEAATKLRQLCMGYRASRGLRVGEHPVHSVEGMLTRDQMADLMEEAGV